MVMSLWPRFWPTLYFSQKCTAKCMVNQSYILVVCFIITAV